ncbi:MAG: DUF4236 domain-containing protein [Cyanobacteria bacterium J06649_11]
MALSFFRSKKAGPFRINVSSSGIGFSFGVKGARVNFSPRGTFVSIGAKGIYYRKKISSKKEKEKESLEVNFVDSSEGQSIGTINVDQLTDIDSQQLVDEIDSKRRKISLLTWFGLIPSIILLVGLCNQEEEKTVQVSNEVLESYVVITGSRVNIRASSSSSSDILSTAIESNRFKYLDEEGNWLRVDGLESTSRVGYVHNSLAERQDTLVTVELAEQIKERKNSDGFLFGTSIFLLGWCALLMLFDKRRKTVELYYAFDDDMMKVHKHLTKTFSEFNQSRKKWYYTYSQRTRDRKYFAGASELVKRNKINQVSLDSEPVPYFKCNLEIPSIILGKTEMYFLPERLLIRQGNKFAGLMYKNLDLESTTTRFIEDERVPSDAKVIDQTYKYVNKDGRPDKRFKGNYQIPICLYSQYRFSSDSGVDEVVVTSRLEAMDRFFKVLDYIGKFEEGL